jgi:rhodanese-related sulfurtransferase
MTPVRRALLLAASLLGALAPFAGTAAPKASPAANRENLIAPLELAAWLRDRKPGLRLIDVRNIQDFDVFHLPAAESGSSDSPPNLNFRDGDHAVFYGEGTIPFAMTERIARSPLAGAFTTYILRGGLNAWVDEVLNPILLPEASAAEKAEFERTRELSRYFGGLPRVLNASEAAQHRAKKPSAVNTRGRGC